MDFRLGQGYIIANTVAAGKIGNGNNKADRLYQFNQGGNPDTLNVWGFYSGNGLGANNVIALDGNDTFKLTGDWILDGYGAEGSGTGISGQIFHDNNGHKLLISGGQVDGYVGSAHPTAGAPNVTIVAPALSRDQIISDITAMAPNGNGLVKADEIQTALNTPGKIDPSHVQYWQDVIKKFDTLDNNVGGNGHAVAHDHLINVDDILGNTTSSTSQSDSGGNNGNSNTDATQYKFRDLGDGTSPEFEVGKNGDYKESYVVLKNNQKLTLYGTDQGEWTKEENQVDVPKDPNNPTGETQKATLYSNPTGEKLAVVGNQDNVSIKPKGSIGQGTNSGDTFFDNTANDPTQRAARPTGSDLTFGKGDKTDHQKGGFAENLVNSGKDKMTIDSSDGMTNVRGVIASESNDTLVFKGDGWKADGTYKDKGTVYVDNNGNKVLVTGNPTISINPAADSVTTLPYRKLEDSPTPRLSAGENGDNKEAYVILNANQKLTLADTSLGKWTQTEEQVDVPKDPNQPNGQTQKATVYTSSAGDKLAVVGNVTMDHGSQPAPNTSAPVPTGNTTTKDILNSDYETQNNTQDTVPAMSGDGSANAGKYLISTVNDKAQTVNFSNKSVDGFPAMKNAKMVYEVGPNDSVNFVGTGWQSANVKDNASGKTGVLYTDSNNNQILVVGATSSNVFMNTAEVKKQSATPPSGPAPAPPAPSSADDNTKTDIKALLAGPQIALDGSNDLFPFMKPGDSYTLADIKGLKDIVRAKWKETHPNQTFTFNNGDPFTKAIEKLTEANTDENTALLNLIGTDGKVTGQELIDYVG
jgi:hypothetical protein